MVCHLTAASGVQAYVLYSHFDANVPRGMACIAAFLLAVLGPGREEDVFWTLVGLLENRVPRSCVLEVLSRKTLSCTSTTQRWFTWDATSGSRSIGRSTLCLAMGRLVIMPPVGCVLA